MSKKAFWSRPPLWHYWTAKASATKTLCGRTGFIAVTHQTTTPENVTCPDCRKEMTKQ